MEMILERLMFTCIGKGHGAPCLPANREDWEKLRREPWLKEMCERIERGDEQLKHRLPVWTPHCAEFKNNHRAIADAVRPLNRLMLDFDEKGHTDEICARLLEQSPLVPLLIEESVRRGTHVLVELPDGMTAEQAQQLMKEATGFEPDAAVKDVSRCIYMVSEDHTKYVSDKLFEVSEDCERKSQPTSDEGCELKSLPTSEAAQEPHTELMFKGIPYTSIIAEWWHRNGGEPAEGERNVKLHKLAVSLRAICDNKKEVLMQVMPRFGLSDVELRSVVDSACKETPKGISKMMQGIVDALEMGISSDEIEDAEAVREEIGVKVNVKALPMGLKESLTGVPVSMHMPVLCGVLPIAAAYADQVMVEYCDGNLQHLGLMSIIRGEQASNKSVVKNAIDVWKRQFDEEDALARKREEEWKERKKGRKANEKAPDDPKVLIRMVPVTVSCSTLLKRFKNAQGHTLYSFGEELDTLRKTNGAGSWSSKYDIYRLSFDKGEWGQDYNSDAAESGVVKVAYNWTMLGTNGALRKCFKSDNIENGLSSRILVAEMPDSSFSKMPKFGRRSAGDEAMIQEAVTRLRAFSGLIDTPRLRKAIEQWVEQKRVEAAKDIDHVKDTYRKRAAVIGFRCGVVFHLLSMGARNLKSQTSNLKESKACIDFALMMAEYCLSQQIKAFGEALQNQYVDAHEECQRYGANHSVFDQLAPTFTLDDLRALKRGYCSESAMRMIISRWMRDGWISKTDRYHWSKVKVNSEK
ncbi:DUF3987 domain-containing protein [uncultured Prevotella sp.]|uniref:DUF3987 domain-containing protein n=1 Tax=uncultured Prevotella sp. TaxID=159272 RepID=UPI00258AB912|nr:DUF3987 domain-containing protein [uncultured Prevotella sp.]